MIGDWVNVIGPIYLEVVDAEKYMSPVLAR